MGRRLKLHEELCTILGSKNVYWQPPESLKMTYPCIVYEESPNAIRHADNKPYILSEAWDITVIRPYKDRDKTKEIVNKIPESFRHCRQSSHFVSDNLVHDVFQIYY